MRRRWVMIVMALAMMAIACKSTTGGGSGSDDDPPTPTKGFPSSMVALGDSITAGYATCLAPAPCPRNSWSTGDGTRVSSHYRQITKANPAMSGHARNLAEPGATVEGLNAQVAAAVKRPVDYVTILIGANDACRGTMTSTEAFRERIDRALGTLKKGMPKARVLLVGVPNVYRVWEVGHTSAVATRVWKSGTCANLLANATSTAKADVDRRAAFRDQLADYNTQLRRACSAYGSKCRFDDISRLSFDLGMLSAIDYFHPNATGQDLLAEETYPSAFSW